MASIIAHPFVALALTPYFRRAGITPGIAVLGAVCTIVPDLDVIGFRFGIPYESLFGHRGFSHSLFFAAMLAAALTIPLRYARPRASAAASFIFLFLCTASHAALDALTDGGLGVAFFSPFSNDRFFFSWPVLAVSPLSVSRFLTGQGLTILSSEFRWVMLPSILVFFAGYLATRRTPGMSGNP